MFIIKPFIRKIHVCLIYQLNALIESNFRNNVWDSLKAVNIRLDIVAYNNVYIITYM